MDLGIWLQCELKNGNGANMFSPISDAVQIVRNRSHVIVLSTELPDQRMVHLKEWHEMRNICAIRKYTISFHRTLMLPYPFPEKLIR